VIFGITGYTQAKQLDTKNSGKNLAIAGMTCGVVGLMLAVWRYLH
jgi:hypothetical protein